MEQKNKYICSEMNTLLAFSTFVLIIIAYMCNKVLIALGISLLFTVLILKNRNWRAQIKIGLTYILMFAYLTYTFLVTLLNSEYLEEFYISGLEKIFCMLLFFLVFVCMLNSIRIDKFIELIRKFALIVVIMCFVEAVLRFPIWEYALTLSVNGYVENMINTPSYRIVGLFKHPIMCAVFLSTILIILVRIPSKSKWKNGIFIVLTIFDLLATKSRSVIIATTVSFLSLIVYKMIFVKKILHKEKKINKNFFVSIPILIILLAILLYTMRDTIIQNISQLYVRFVTMFDTGDAGGEIVRIETAKASFKHFSENSVDGIFGRGIYASQNYLKHNPIVKGTWEWTGGIDNQYITIIFESGLFGILVILLMHLRQLFLILKKRTDTLITYGLIIVMYLVGAFFYESFLFYNTYVFYVVVNIMLELELKKKLGEQYDEK